MDASYWECSSLELSCGLTDVCCFLTLYNVQNTLNIKQIQAMEEKKEKKKEEHGMDLDRFPCHSVHYFLCVIVGTKKSEERPDQEVKGLAIG